MLKAVVIFISLFLLLGCDANLPAASSQKDSTVTMANSLDRMKTQVGTVNKEIAFVGKVVYVELEGGFWAVITDQGARLDGKLPDELRLNNQRISGFYKPQNELMSFHMWGTLVTFSQLKAIGEPSKGGGTTK